MTKPLYSFTVSDSYARSAAQIREIAEGAAETEADFSADMGDPWPPWRLVQVEGPTLIGGVTRYLFAVESTRPPEPLAGS